MTDGLELNQLQVFQGGDTPMMQITHHVQPGAVLSVMGPSGSGKSTLLAAITGTLPPGFRMTGTIHLNGRDLCALPTHKRRVGLLFQDALLFPHLSVGANLAFGLPPGGSRAVRQARIDTALAEVGLTGFAARDPATLSGGQAARVALIRTLLAAPDALLLDEPFSKLDADLRDQVRGLVFTMARTRNLPVVMVTHDADDANAAGGAVITLR